MGAVLGFLRGESFFTMNDFKVLVINPATLLPDGEEMAGAHWFESFFETLGNASCDFILASGENIGGLIGDYDGVVIWDIQESAWEDNPRNDQLLDVIAICQFKKIPLLGVGFGAELLIRALDGQRVSRDQLNAFAHNELLYGEPYDFKESGRMLSDFVTRLSRSLA